MSKIAPGDDHVKLSVGDRVRRGEDWNRGDEDLPNVVGVVTAALDDNGLVSVAWAESEGNEGRQSLRQVYIRFWKRSAVSLF